MCFTKHVAVKTYGALGVQHHVFLTPTLDGQFTAGGTHSPRKCGNENKVQIYAAISEHDISVRKNKRYMLRAKLFGHHQTLLK